MNDNQTDSAGNTAGRSDDNSVKLKNTCESGKGLSDLASMDMRGTSTHLSNYYPEQQDVQHKSRENQKVVIKVNFDEAADILKPPVLAKQSSSQSDVVIHGIEPLLQKEPNADAQGKLPNEGIQKAINIRPLDE